jgi:hypothetical protein
MQAQHDDPQNDETAPSNIEEQLAYINETIKEIENEDCSDSDHEEKPPTPLADARESKDFDESYKEESESEIERRECDSCHVIPDEIINMNCVHNICVDCTLNVGILFMVLVGRGIG